VALVGACLMVAGGALSLEDAYKAVDLDTLTLLLGMMIVVAISASRLLCAGERLGDAAGAPPARAAGSGYGSDRRPLGVPRHDAICLVLAPLVLELTLSLRRNPVPYLLAVAMASNIGSTATITATRRR